MLKEKQIIHENGMFWVCENSDDYTVYKIGVTHSVSDSAYEKSEDGKSIAIARCDYLAKRHAKACLPVGQSDLFKPLLSGYYVTMIDGPKTALLLGPFDFHFEALEMVEPARKAAIEINGFYHFCAFGTAKLTARDLPDGKFNSKLL